MISLPPIPTWDGLHPLIIHFPIVLLLTAPIFILVAMFMPVRPGRHIYSAGFLLLLVGTISAFVSYETGEAAGKLAERTPEINAAIEQHESLAETTRLLFSVLTVLLGAFLAIPKLFKIEPTRAIIVSVSAVFLLFYASATVVLVNTAHQGGMLVHQHGVHALVAPQTTPPPVTPHEGD